MNKRCTKCNKVKELMEFHKDKNGKYGRRGECKRCRILYKRQYDKEHFETSKQYRIKNKVRIANVKKEYCQNNRKFINKHNRQYYKDNPELMRKYYSLRKGWGKPLPINNYFEDSHLHHLHIENDRQICIYIPIKLHKSVWHAYNKPDTMIEINLKVMQWYYGLTIDW